MRTRRSILGGLAGAAALAVPLRAQPAPPPSPRSAPEPAARTIPSTGEAIPAVGLGTWITFNVGNDAVLRDECTAVVAAFFAAGGRLIDSSPMYGSSQPTIGHALAKLDHPAALFSAEKVWTSSARNGRPQIDQSLRLWGVPRFDLVQVHNLLAWEAHLDTLLDMKAQKQLRYVGITTSEGRRHAEIEAVMSGRPIDFVQVTYNPVDREVERRILPLARERGIAVIVNRPFREGELTRRLAQHPLPAWPAEIGAASWAQLVLKFIVSHPAVTCAIPATTRVDHVRENLAAAAGPLPEEPLRRRIAEQLGRL
ncbi:aldo/keto reductase [Rhodoplanes sp. SY1]|uniref:aldo/keto reductase n=1 Tax=Rhodoplanes sp. SY1 TaxID=3166646 RepID=UPI0038B58473